MIRGVSLLFQLIGLFLLGVALVGPVAQHHTTQAAPRGDHEVVSDHPEEPDPLTTIDEARLERWLAPDIEERIRVLLAEEQLEAALGELKDLASKQKRGPMQARLSFLQARLLTQLNRPNEVQQLLVHSSTEHLGEAAGPALLLLANAYEALGEPNKAIRTLRRIPLGDSVGFPAMMQRTALLNGSGKYEESIALLAEIAVPESEVRDRAHLNLRRAQALIGLLSGDSAQSAHQDTRAEAIAALSEACVLDATGFGATARVLLEDIVGAKAPEMVEARLAYLERLVQLRQQSAATTLANDIRDAYELAADQTCRVALAQARLAVRKRDWVSVRTTLEPSRSCQDPQYFAPSMYLLGRALDRADEEEEAVTVWTMIADRAPDNSLADDALVLAARARIEEDQLESAALLLTRAANEFPEGDLAPEALFRLAWLLWQRNDVDGALTAFETLAQKEPTRSSDHFERAGSYFGALLHAQQGSDASLAVLEEMAGSRPFTWHGLLALQSLRELAPERADEIDSALLKMRETFLSNRNMPLQARLSFLASPDVRLAIEYYRLGLFSESTSYLEAIGSRDDLISEERVVLGELYRRMGDIRRSHGLFRDLVAMGEMNVPTPESSRAWALAYPLAYHDLVVQACAPDNCEPLFLQALSREESAFDHAIVSPAGAVGLAQLMWPTAQDVAKKNNIPISRDDLVDPLKNLSLGALYLRRLSDQWNGHEPLVLASYNAGPTATRRWLNAAAPDERLDVFVENIPYDETRGYVKRVMSTYHTYLILHGTASSPLDLCATARPSPGND